MSAIWLSVEHPRLVRTTNRSALHESKPTGASELTDQTRRVSRLGARDHRDDGSTFVGILVGLTFAVLAWALIIALLVVLL